MPTNAPRAWYKHFAITRLTDLGGAYLMERARIVTRIFVWKEHV